MRAHGEQRRRGIDGGTADQRRLGSAGGGQHERAGRRGAPTAPSAARRESGAGRRLAQARPRTRTARAYCGYLPRRRQHAERDRQVEAPRFLRQVGRGEVDGDLARRKLEVRVLKCRTHAVARLADFGVGRPTRLKAGNPPARCTSTVTSGASSPARPRESTTASDIGEGSSCVRAQRADSVEFRQPAALSAVRPRRNGAIAWFAPAGPGNRRDGGRAMIRRITWVVLAAMPFWAAAGPTDSRPSTLAELPVAAMKLVFPTTTGRHPRWLRVEAPRSMSPEGRGRVQGLGAAGPSGERRRRSSVETRVTSCATDSWTIRCVATGGKCRSRERQRAAGGSRT